jgi:hypothetical protein
MFSSSIAVSTKPELTKGSLFLATPENQANQDGGENADRKPTGDV